MKVGAGVSIAPYNPLWPDEFDRVRTELLDTLPSWILSIEHVGSTSVPGLDAKPIIDILVAVPNLSASLTLVPALEGLGFVYRPDDELPDRHYFPRTVAGLRRHHLSLAEPRSWHYQNSVNFRDALR
ncbi:GrpB family protein [Phycisphaerales bacterium AB-hyl4]|uniref:GrpB family protein n=1 Tax=Natronomicrosphaera hydrolytica TaxID=3242702 RepID=A0ABV4U182_9BACT